MKLSTKSKKWLLTVHILFSAIMFGNVATFILLSITAAATENTQLMEACYQIMHLLSNTSVKASTFATIISGILLSVWTKWGLFKFYWLIAKEGLSIVLLILNLWGMNAWTTNVLIQISKADMSGNTSILPFDLWIGILIQLLTLLFIYILSIFKPWGKRK